MALPSVIHTFSLSDLSLTPGLFENRLGYGQGESPAPIPEIINNIFEQAPSYCDIKGGYVLPVRFEILDETAIIADDLVFNSGKIITGSLRKSEKIAFYLMTAGLGIEQWSRSQIRGGDPLAGYIIDMLGSEIVESATDLMQSELEKVMNNQEYRITNRYSPGYCGWLVEEQQKLFTLFPENFCGITLSESSLMVPIKSVSGVIGIGREVKKTAYGCQICEMKNCKYRNRMSKNH